MNLLTPAPAREIFTWDIPDEILLESTTTKSIGLAYLTPMEEKAAIRRANGDAIAMAFELAMASLCEWNVGKVAIHDGTSDIAYAAMHPKVRSLLVEAYSDLSTPSKAATVAFQKSRRVRTA